MKKYTVLLLMLLCISGYAASESKNFAVAMNDVKKYYVRDISDEVLFENAIRGMMEGLDPYCAYLDKDDFRDLNEATRGNFAGVGLEVTMEKGVIRVITPLSGTPAQKAGIKSGDYILKLDNTPVLGMTIRSAIHKMRGPVDSIIILKMYRKGQKKTFNVSLKREIIHLESVQEQLWDHYYGYLKVSQFQASTAHELSDAIVALQKKAKGSLKGLILDLRNNPGGLLDAAVEVSDIFLPNKSLIVYTKGRYPGSKIKRFAQSDDHLDKMPLVVLINGGSASAAEIVAGALKDNHRAVLLGSKTFGKGSVQTVIPLDKESAIKLTTALYYTPSGISIQAKGITPDIIVEPVSWKSTVVDEDADDNETTEADLQGHLASALSSELSSQKQSNYRNDNQLLRDDYVLYQALNVLQGMALTHYEKY